MGDGTLTNCLMELCKALGEAVRDPRFIATVHRQGYRFLAPVTRIDPLPPDAEGLPTAALHAVPGKPIPEPVVLPDLAAPWGYFHPAS